VLKINGADIPAPAVFKVDISDIDGETTRNAKGDLLRDRITTKRKLSCEWPPLTMAAISTILQAVQDEFFQVTYPDPMTGSMQTKTFYVGDRSAPLYWKDKNGQYRWKDLKMNFIEK